MWSTSQSQSSTLIGGSGGPNGFLAFIALSATKGSDSPSSVTALTLKRYSWFSSRPLAGQFVTSAGVSHSGSHFPVALSIFSTMYFRIGLPPSSSGGLQLSLQESLVAP